MRLKVFKSFKFAFAYAEAQNALMVLASINYLSDRQVLHYVRCVLNAHRLCVL